MSSALAAPSGYITEILQLQGYKFTVNSTPFLQNQKIMYHISIQPEGLSIDNREITFDTDSRLVAGEINDMDVDGYPEILLFFKADKPGHPMEVYGYSVNNGKSLSAIAMPELVLNPSIDEAYNGEQQLAMAERYLLQRYPIKTFGYCLKKIRFRQMQYVLQNGENSKKFVLAKMIEY